MARPHGHFDGDVVEGPVPILFAANPEVAVQALTDNPDKAFKDLQRIFSKFFVPENIPAEAAMPQISNPRAPEVAFPFRRPGCTFKGPPAKHARISEQPSTAPGTSTAAETMTGT